MKRFSLVVLFAACAGTPSFSVEWVNPPKVVNSGTPYLVVASDPAVNGGSNQYGKTVEISKSGGTPASSSMGGGVSELVTATISTTDIGEKEVSFTAVLTMQIGSPVVTTIGPMTVKIDANPPTTPTNLAAGAAATSLTLNWERSTDTMSSVAGYEIDRTGAAVVSSVGASYTITGLTPNTAYQIRVRARDIFNHWSDWGPYLNVTTQHDPMLDHDGDGIANGWEARYPTAVDPNGDADEDGWSNLDEYRRGTDPLAGDPTPGASTLVAALSGDFSVDNKGSANYTIPLKLPPGRGGLQPSLALAYSSGGGNGPMGFGWSVATGFPQAITRGRSILARDGEVRGVEFKSSDKFYLDGKRLICVSQDRAYGEPGSIYRTEVDSFVTITTTGTGSSAGDWNIDTFVVTDKSGVQMTFGKYSSSVDGYRMGALANETKAHAYALKHVQDLVGNAVDFNYSEILDGNNARQGEYVLSEVLYTANPSQSITAQARVQFDYHASPRPDASSSFAAGRQFAQTRRLDAIRAQFNTGGDYTDVSRYNLEYAYTTTGSRLRLMAVAPSFRNPASGIFETPPKTTFTWTDATIAAGPKVGSSLSGKNPHADFRGHNPFAWGDFNGDGREDYAALNGADLSVSLATDSGFIAGGGMTISAGWYGSLWAADINGDGRKDLFIVNGGINGAITQIHAAISTGSGFTSLSGSPDAPTLVTSTDDAFGDPGQTTFELRDAEAGGAGARIVPGDFTGDGRDDLLLHGYDGNLYLYRSEGTSFAPVQTSNSGGPPCIAGPVINWMGIFRAGSTTYQITRNFTIKPLPADYNGDGLTDYAWVNLYQTAPVNLNASPPQALYYQSSKDLYVALARTEGGFTAGQVASSQTTSGAGDDFILQQNLMFYVLPGDFNGDGMTDLLMLRGAHYAPNQRWTLMRSRGTAASGGLHFDLVPGIIPETFIYGGQTLPTFYKPVENNAWTSWGMDDAPTNPRFRAPEIASAFAHVATTTGDHTFAQDVNQDGLTDLVWFVWKDVGETSATHRGWYVMYSTGSGFSAASKLTGQPWDDIDDLVEPLTTGNHQYAPTRVSLSGGSDLNGDGHPDWTYQYFTTQGDQGLKGWFLGQGTFPNLITGFNAGPGGRTEIIYQAAKSDGIYTPGAPVTYPIRDLRASTPVVADTYKDSGDYFGFFGEPLFDLSGVKQRNVAHFSYQYSGNRLDLSGRGPLGFHSFVTLDRQTNLFKYQFLAQSFPMTGLTAREQTYRYWESDADLKFRLISSHDNTVVFDEVVKTPTDSTPWGTVYPFMSKAVELRWEDETTAHFTLPRAPSPATGPRSSADPLFTKARPAGAHIEITAESRFEEQSAVQTTLPGAYKPSDRTTDWDAVGTNVVVGSTNYATFHAAFAGPTFHQISYGNLKQLKTDFGGDFSEQVVTTYAPPVDVVVNGITVRTLFGRPASVSTTVTSPAPYGTENAPSKSYTYATVGGAQTALVDVETVTASDPKLSFSTDFDYDSQGRRTTTTISGYDNPGPNEGATVIGSLTDANVQHVGSFIASSITGYEEKYDLPRTTKNAQPYEHTTTTAYHSFLGQPTSVINANGAEVTTDYDALGRPTKVTDVLKQLATRSGFAWTTASASDWKKTQTVAPPGGHTGVASGAPVTGVVGVTVASVYATRAYETRANDDLSYKPEVWTYFDRLGRAIRTIKVGFNEQKTITDSAYNNLGQVIAVTLPYPEGGTKYWTRTTYDALGRVVTVTAPNGTVTSNEYFGRATRVTVDAANFGGANPGPQTNVTLVDFKGRTVKVWNANNLPATITVDGTGMSAPSIEYRLDGFGRMRETWLEGSDGTVPTKKITATYDDHGRQLSLNDPDKGYWAYLNNALGHVVKQKDARGSVTRSTFDRLGRQRSRETKETDSSPVETADWFYYDLATTASGHPALHLVDRAQKGWIGAPQRERLLNSADTTGYQPSTRSLVGNPHDTETVHYYNDKGLPAIDLSSIDGKWFYTATEYDPTYWRVSQVRHFWRPSLLEAGNSQPYVWHDYGYTYGYGSRSYLTTMTDSVGRIWWDQPSYDHLDRVVSARKGQGLFTQRTYRSEDGVLTALKTGPSVGAFQIQDLTFSFDGLGNLIDRTGPPGTETFGYDILNRLTTRNGGVIAAYASNGNITSKVDVTGASSGTYSYSATQPHAVTSAWEYTMGYDANGNLNTRSGGGSTWAFRYAGFDKPRWMARDTSGSDFTNGTFGSEFLYNANRSRVLHLEFDQMTSGVPSHYMRKKVYAYGATMEVDYDNTAAAGAAAWSMKTVRIYVPGPEGSIGTMEFKPNAPFDQAEKKLVYHYDHLGSIESITNWGDTSGTLAADDSGKPSRFSYDPWGERRNPTTWSGKPQTTGGNASDDGGPDGVTERGFTGHEMLDGLGLVHMNGRIYDGLLGRMLSADVFIQGPGDLQSYNRYSYVGNNPLTMIDPSGFIKEATVSDKTETSRGLTGFTSTRVMITVVTEDNGVVPVGTTGARVSSLSHSVVFGDSQTMYGPHYGADAIDWANEHKGMTVAEKEAITVLVATVIADSIANQPAKEEADKHDPQTGSDGGRVDSQQSNSGEQGEGNKTTTLSETRYTSEGESSRRYESDNPDYSKINPDGSVKPGTFAAPSSDPPLSQSELNETYNLPNPEIPRTNATTITPPAGTPVIGPRTVQGGTGSEVIYPNGAPPGSAGPRQPVPVTPPPPDDDPLKKR